MPCIQPQNRRNSVSTDAIQTKRTAGVTTIGHILQSRASKLPYPINYNLNMAYGPRALLREGITLDRSSEGAVALCLAFMLAAQAEHHRVDRSAHCLGDP